MATSSPYLHEFAALALIHFLAVLAPGPDFAVTLRQSVRHGRRAGQFTALGIGAGISVHVLYTLLGVGALMHATPWLLDSVRLLGSGYLLYLGVRLLRSPAPAHVEDPLETAGGEAATATPPGALSCFGLGFLTNATNPKATLFFLAVFTSQVDPATPLAIQALYGAWMCAVNALWFMAVGVLFTTARVRRAFLRIGHWLERGIGTLLIAFAARLAILS